jgi:AcrR family transcriptional regulator
MHEAVAKDDADPTGARTRLLDAAEKLVALRGEGAAASRAIIFEAGQRHNSAISYHFGTRRELFDAVWERRGSEVDRYRAPLLAHLGSPTLEGLVTAYVVPLARYLDERTPSYWARFNEESLRRYPLALPARLRTNLDEAPAGTGLLTLLDVFERMQKLTCDGVEPAAALRVTQAVRMVITTFAAWERERDGGTTTMTAGELGAHLVPGVVGLLEAGC